NYTTKEYSPVFRYPYATAAAAVAVAPPARDGSRRVRYVNPLTGGSGGAVMDCFLVQLQSGAGTLPFRTPAHLVLRGLGGLGGRLGREPSWRRHHPMEQAGHLHVAAGQPDRSQEQRRNGPPVPGVRPRYVCPARAAHGRIREYLGLKRPRQGGVRLSWETPSSAGDLLAGGMLPAAERGDRAPRVLRCGGTDPAPMAQVASENTSHVAAVQRAVLVGKSATDARSRAGFWALTLGTIGVVYGDIGTSPLYAMRESLVAAVGAGN